MEEVVLVANIALEKVMEHIPKITFLNHRGTAHPLAMIETLATLEKCLPGDTVITHNDRRPEDLIVELNKLGYSYAILELPDGSVKVKIYKP